VVSLLMIFINYTGTGDVSATARLFGALLFACKIYAVPLLWIWARDRSDGLRSGLVLAGLVTIFGGVTLFGTQMVAAAKPVASYYLTNMDVQMAKEFWNRLEPGTKVFDPKPFRATTVFGRFTNAYSSWWEAPKPEWQALVDAPDPYRLHAAGYDYAYYDIGYWNSLPKKYQELLQSSCVKQVQQVDGYISETNYGKDFRRLVDISTCK
jgi:hypothetical protein